MRLNAEIKDEVYKAFQKQAELDGRSTSDVIRVLVLEWTAERTKQRLEMAALKEENDERRN